MAPMAMAGGSGDEMAESGVKLNKGEIEFEVYCMYSLVCIVCIVSWYAQYLSHFKLPSIVYLYEYSIVFVYQMIFSVLI